MTVSKNWTKFLSIITVFFMLFSAQVFAGNGGSFHHKKKKCGFFSKIGKCIKKAVHKTCKKIKKAAKKAAKKIKKTAKKIAHKIKCGIKTAGAKINNAIKDTYVKIKLKLTCKKKRTWVCGHCDKNGRWTKGHWRKMGKGSGNNPGKGNSPGQGYDPLPPVEDPVDPTLTPSSEVGETPPAEEAPAEGVPATETPSDDSTTSAAAMAEPATDTPDEEQISTDTMGKLMDDVVAQSNEITDFRKVAVTEPDYNFSVSTTNGVVNTYSKREEKAKLVVKVIAIELRRNNGKSGKYFTYFKYKMSKMKKNDRHVIKDLVLKVKEAIEHGLGHCDEKYKAAYKARLSEISNY